MEGLAAALSLPRPLCALLAVRGIGDPEGAKAFLRPRLETLHPPELMAGLPRAVERVASAIRSGETLLVHGDYDVDGMSATTLLTRWIRRLGGKVAPFIPNRLTDGYDLGPAGLAAAREAGATLLLTVDCGTLAHGAVEEANAAGMDVVVTDHHAPGETLPPALCVLNPNRPDCSYPDKGLCGAGVAYKLAQGLGEEFRRPPEELHPYLDLVAMATVADLVPLSGENRTLVRFGLRALARTENPGLRSLMARAGVEGPELQAGSVGYVLAPRLNAVGRMGDPSSALRLLLTEDPDEAESLAREAETLNRSRQELDRETLEQALDLLEATYDPARDYGVVLAGEGWHPGVIGIVASRVVERIHRPAILVALGEESGRGSGRSIPGFHLLEAIRAGGEHLERFGGHRQAAGLDVLRSSLPAFREAFARAAREKLEGEPLQPRLRVDLEVGLDELTRELHGYMEYLGPHGMGNPRPLLLARGVEASGRPRVVGRNHLKLRLNQNGASLEGIGFDLAERVPPGSLGAGPLEVVFHLQENEYRGVRSLQARIRDIRPLRGAP